MAGDWIKWTKGLARKPEVLQIAAHLGISRHAAAGLLMEVWEWADDNVLVDDSVSGFDPDNCPASVRFANQSLPLFDATFGVSGLADAMTAVGWMIARSGSLTFPNFARHNGKSAKARALDSSRKRTDRGKNGIEGKDGVQNPSGLQPDKTRTREEKRREEKEEEKSQYSGTATAVPVGQSPQTVATVPAEAKPKKPKGHGEGARFQLDACPVPWPTDGPLHGTFMNWTAVQTAAGGWITNRHARDAIRLIAERGVSDEDAAKAFHDAWMARSAGIAAYLPKTPSQKIYDAIHEITGCEGSHVAAVAAGMVGRYTPDDVREFGRRFYELCPYAAEGYGRLPNVGEVEKYIPRIRAVVPPPSAKPLPALTFKTNEAILVQESLRREAEELKAKERAAELAARNRPLAIGGAA